MISKFPELLRPCYKLCALWLTYLLIIGLPKATVGGRVISENLAKSVCQQDSRYQQTGDIQSPVKTSPCGSSKYCSGDWIQWNKRCDSCASSFRRNSKEEPNTNTDQEMEVRPRWNIFSCSGIGPAIECAKNVANAVTDVAGNVGNLARSKPVQFFKQLLEFGSDLDPYIRLVSTGFNLLLRLFGTEQSPDDKIHAAFKEISDKLTEIEDHVKSLHKDIIEAILKNELNTRLTVLQLVQREYRNYIEEKNPLTLGRFNRTCIQNPPEKVMTWLVLQIKGARSSSVTYQELLSNECDHLNMANVAKILTVMAIQAASLNVACFAVENLNYPKDDVDSLMEKVARQSSNDVSHVVDALVVFDKDLTTTSRSTNCMQNLIEGYLRSNKSESHEEFGKTFVENVAPSYDWLNLNVISYDTENYGFDYHYHRQNLTRNSSWSFIRQENRNFVVAGSRYDGPTFDDCPNVHNECIKKMIDRSFYDCDKLMNFLYPCVQSNCQYGYTMIGCIGFTRSQQFQRDFWASNSDLKYTRRDRISSRWHKALAKEHIETLAYYITI